MHACCIQCLHRHLGLACRKMVVKVEKKDDSNQPAKRAKAGEAKPKTKAKAKPEQTAEEPEPPKKRHRGKSGA